MKKFKSFIICSVLFMCNCLSIGQERHLVFQNAPVFKLVIGVGVPVRLDDDDGKSLSWFTNLQVKYKLPEDVGVFIPNGYKSGKSAKHYLNGDFFYEALHGIVRRFDPTTTDEDFLRLVCGVTRARPDDYPGLSEDIWTVIQREIFESVKFGSGGACHRNLSAVPRMPGT